jgi:hypothetical protein
MADSKGTLGVVCGCIHLSEHTIATNTKGTIEVTFAFPSRRKQREIEKKIGKPYTINFSELVLTIGGPPRPPAEPEASETLRERVEFGDFDNIEDLYRERARKYAIYKEIYDAMRKAKARRAPPS